jgi:hypothetical protein
MPAQSAVLHGEAATLAGYLKQGRPPGPGGENCPMGVGIVALVVFYYRQGPPLTVGVGTQRLWVREQRCRRA